MTIIIDETIEDFKYLIKGTPGMISFYRGLMVDSAKVTDPNTFDRKATEVQGRHVPISLDAMQDADNEAAYLGELLRYCFDFDVFPRPSYIGIPDDDNAPRLTLGAFWWSKSRSGRCLGLAGYDRAFDDMVIATRVLSDHAYDIVMGLDNFPELFSAWKVLRSTGVSIRMRVNRSDTLTKTEPNVWLTIDEAAMKVDRSDKTIKRWMREGLVEHTSDDVVSDRMITEQSLLSAIASIRLKKKSAIDSARGVLELERERALASYRGEW